MANTEGANISDLTAVAIPTTISVSLIFNKVVPRFLIKQLPITFLLIGAIFNTFMLLYLIASKKYKVPLFTLITSLVVADLCSCLAGSGIAGLLEPYLTITNNRLNICRLVTYTSGIGITSSTHHLVLFAGIRFYQLCYPLRSRARLTVAFMRNCCLGLWIVVCGLWIGYIYQLAIFSEFLDNKVRYRCYRDSASPLISYMFLIGNTIYPGVSIILLHIFKYIRVIQASKSIEVQQQRKNADARAITMVIVVFFLTWVPLNTFQVIPKDPSIPHSYIKSIGHVLVYLMHSNSAINPVIYCFAAESVRNDIIKFLRKSNLLRRA